MIIRTPVLVNFISRLLKIDNLANQNIKLFVTITITYKLMHLITRKAYSTAQAKHKYFLYFYLNKTIRIFLMVNFIPW